MFHKSTLLLTLLFVIASGTVIGGTQFLEADQDPTTELLMQPMYRAGCNMQKFTPIVSTVGYFPGFAPGDGVYTYFDPAVECAASPYPYAITDFSFTLYDANNTLAWPVVLDVVVYDMVPGAGNCAGLGTELCRVQVSADAATFGFPNMGTVSFPNPCCVNGPFYIGLEYVSGASALPASVVFDEQVVDTCNNWLVYQGNLYEWSDAWIPPVPGWPIYAVGGETNAAACDPAADCPFWVDGDPYKSENQPQLPDEAGWDVNATYPKLLADDFMCGETGYIKDIHFWGSWMDGVPGKVQSFILSFHSDISAAQNPDGYSMPGVLLWERVITVFTETPIDAATLEGWYDPYTGDIKADNHNIYMQYDVCLTEPDWFPQEAGTIYWLNISAVVEQVPGTPDALWGWKSTQIHYNDDAVYLDAAGRWVEMYEPDVLGPIINDFAVFVDKGGIVVDGHGLDAFDQGWYRYPSGWWNIWFYDHPFDPTRYKKMHVEFDINPLDPTAEMFIEFALNWSTDTWSIDQPPTDSSPPLPGADENLYIGRRLLLESDYAEGHYTFDFDLPDYNPEWVSIDVRGFNFAIPGGFIEHQCIGDGTGQSLDLSFVVTSDEQGVTGACCLPDGTCIDTDAGDCAAQGGDYQGDGTDCASTNCPQPNNPPVALCQDIVVPADANCEGCGSIDAGSYDPDGDPITLSQNPPCPYPLGTTTVELTVTDDKGATDKCTATVTVVDNTPPVAICPADIAVTVPAGSGGANVNFTVSATDNCPGVTVIASPPSGSFFPVGVTNVIVTAIDAAGLTDICTFKVIVREDPPQGCPPWKPGDPYKQENQPQLPDEAGWDVNATAPKTLADDFKCGETGWIKDVHFWGSWLNGERGQVRAFILSFHEDIPAPLSPTGHSMPGKLLWERRISVFTENTITGAYMEGWYDPWTDEALTNNHQEYQQYDVCLDSKDWFWQEAGKVYWLNITAIIDEVAFPNTQWGWKSSTVHWSDDAVYEATQSTTCVVTDSAGTIHMPPDCPLVPHYGDRMAITDGLPPEGATIEVEIVALSLVGRPTETPNTDGSSTAQVDIEIVALNLTGTGALGGFSRTMSLTGQLTMRVLRHPPDVGYPPDVGQSIQIEILSMDLSSAPGDPDFDVLIIRAGSDHGLPSPGHTTLTQLPSGDWAVDSFFDITYSIEFKGAVAGQLNGLGGTTTGGPYRLGTEGTDTPDWREMYEPLHILGPINNVYSIEIDESGNLINGFGEGAYGDGWYHYPKEQWWNVWFYDHPFDYNRFKTIHVEFFARPLSQTAPTYLEFAINWSTDAWSNDQPTTDSAPPLPGVDENLYIARQTVFASENIDGVWAFDIDIPDYNPEWVSIDVRGFNFFVEGLMVHECIGDGTGQSMDLAFVITGDTVSASTGGACCLPDGTCTETDSLSCDANGGVYRGDGTSCTTANICDPCGWYTNGYTGNINCDTGGKRNLADITRLIDHVYISKLPLCSDREGNVNGDPDGKKNLADITRLIDHVYIGKGPTAPCL